VHRILKKRLIIAYSLIHKLNFRNLTLEEININDLKEKKFQLSIKKETIIKKAINLIFSSSYNPAFKIYNYMSRGNIQDTILCLNQKFFNRRWVIEANLTKTLYNAYPYRLKNLICKDIKCKKRSFLIKNLIRSEYQNKLTNDFGYNVHKNSILFPLLCNIFLDKIDKFILKIKKKYNILVKPSEDLFRVQKKNSLSLSKKRISKKNHYSRYREYLNKKKLSLKSYITKKPISLDYIRYANHFMIGISSPKYVADKIYTELHLFFKDEGLQFDREKILIKDIEKAYVNFLGFTILKKKNKKITTTSLKNN